MTNIVPASDAKSAEWLLQPGAEWWHLVRYGPPGFDVYVRVAFPEDDEEQDTVRAALVTLASHTSTPDRGNVAVWEGWNGYPNPPSAPRLEIPNRKMLLFTGPLEMLRDAPALAWGETPGIHVPPHLVWPADQSWCLACEVDEEIEFTVGCSDRVAHALASAFPGRVRRVRYGEEAPLYRDEVDAPLNDAGSRSTEEVIYMPLPRGIHGGAPRATEEA